MFGFGKKKMTEEEIRQQMQEIEEMSDEDAFRAALALEKSAPEAAAVTLCKAYFLGEVVDQDFNLCVQYARRALTKYRDDGIVWYFAGIAASALDDYPAAMEFLQKAQKFEGVEAAAADQYGYCCYMCACQLKSASNQTLKLTVYNQANYNAALLYAEACGAYKFVVQKDVSQMTSVSWYVYGVSLQFLLEMAYQGQLVNLGIQDNSVGSWVSASFRALNSKLDEEKKAFWKEVCWQACSEMEAAGCGLTAESFRTSFNCCICRFEHSTEAFYRAKWHETKAREYLPSADAEEKENWNEFYELIFDLYNKQERKYSAMVLNKMLDGALPVLAPSYPNGQAPDPESNQVFMEEFHRERNAQQLKNSMRAAQPEKKKGGLFGLFRK